MRAKGNFCPQVGLCSATSLNPWNLGKETGPAKCVYTCWVLPHIHITDFSPHLFFCENTTVAVVPVSDPVT